MALKTNYKDDVLSSSMNGRRKYQMIDNDDGTVSFEDKTEYDQEGDVIKAEDINEANELINRAYSRITSASQPESQQAGEIWEKILT